MPPTIVSVDNTPADGQHLDVTLAGPPSTGLGFVIGYEPTAGWDVPTPVNIGGNTWRIDVGNTVTDTPYPGTKFLGEPLTTRTRLPVYVNAFDDTGNDDVVVCEWICFGTNKDWMVQLEEKIQGILYTHLPALNRALVNQTGGQTWPDGLPIEIERILVSSAEEESDSASPVIVVSVSRLVEDLSATGGQHYTDAAPISGNILVEVPHQGNTTLVATVCRALGNACWGILNVGRYYNLPLPCGLMVTMFHVTELEDGEVQDEETGGFFCRDTLAFTGELSIARVGGVPPL